VSSGFDPSGKQLIWFPTDRRGTYAAEVPLARGTTPYVRYGDLTPWIAVVVTTLTAITWAFLELSRRRW
ncbi:MAG: apolipoprotein N-acyltransferase, partial [Acidimicrobiia bacterium]